MPLVITACTNRKRQAVPDDLRVSTIPIGTVAAVAAQWAERLRVSPMRLPASTIYGGRSFQEASEAARQLDARLLVVSAGLGLIDATDRIPAYGCTVAAGVPDSVAGRIATSFSGLAWWTELQAVSPFAQSVAETLADTKGQVLVALPSAYLSMLADDLGRLSPPALARVRVFTRTPPNGIPEALQPLVMPYDDRLDGPDSPIRGTRSDFASRAIRHFAEHIGEQASAAAAQEAVRDAIGAWRIPEVKRNRRYDDAQLSALMRAHWSATGGSSTRLLRLFREELGIACEQSRFAMLARQVREEMA